MLRTSRWTGVRGFLLTVTVVFMSLVVQARSESDDFKGFVKIPSGRELFVNWHQAEPGKPTVVLLNGLTYSTRQWDQFTEALTQMGVGVLRYDMFGMGETLLKYGWPFKAIPYSDQVEDLNALIQVLGLEGPLNIAGLSYGGGIAMAFGAAYPEKVKNLILMAPYTAPLEEQDQIIKSLIAYVRMMQPWNTTKDSQLYDFFLAQIVYSTYPRLEPVIMENPYKLQATFRLVQGIRNWTAASVVKRLPKDSVHLMVAGRDQYLKREIMQELWQSIPFSSRGSYILINNADHKIPESVPFFAASWVNEILKKDSRVQNGRMFEADPYTGKIRSTEGDFHFPPEREGRAVTWVKSLKKKVGCSDVLR